MKSTETLQNIHRNLGKLGDMPVFSATVNRIQQISASEESDAMALAMAVMKDASLSARLLKLANSPTYKRGQGNITVVSRAVVLLGFNQIKNICLTLKLIESFHNNNPEIDMPGMMMEAFLGATIAKELALQSRKNTDAEEVYIGALLYGLGEIVVACTLPKEYSQMQQMRQRGDKSWPSIQLEVLGISLSKLGKELAVGWGYPQQVVASMGEVDPENLDPKAELHEQLPALSHQLLQQLYGKDEHNEKPFGYVIDAISELTNMQIDDIGELTLQCFRQVSKVGRDYGLRSASLVPSFAESGDPGKDELTRKLAFLAHSEAEQNGTPLSAPVAKGPSEDEIKQLRLEYMHELTELISSEGKVHEVLKLAVEAIRMCTEMDRSMLCLLNRPKTHLSVKMIEGEGIEKLQTYFEREKNNKADDLFFRVLSKQVTLLVNDLDEAGWRDRLPPDFVKIVDCQGFVLMPLTMGKRVIGMLYADRLAGTGAISDADFNTFNQFVSQTRLALMYADSRSKK